ncbi:hypothetical protein KOY_02976 [Bacillus cereus VDM021]|nr:hypothetical protein [Bacillus pseudomycoides]EOP52906.1 hypothetical protein IIW_02080 [Bacillus cereus VD136]EOQ05190.1 hypothetical protein KOY_02976 [Bacillus cereus VDM021]OOG91895.1 hypothetical protein BTH41_01003 [Bacillus mycoides]
MEDTITSFSYGNHSDGTVQDARKFYQFYVDIDIGASFHVDSYIKFDAFLAQKGIAW